MAANYPNLRVRRSAYSIRQEANPCQAWGAPLYFFLRIIVTLCSPVELSDRNLIQSESGLNRRLRALTTHLMGRISYESKPSSEIEHLELSSNTTRRYVLVAKLVAFLHDCRRVLERRQKLLNFAYVSGATGNHLFEPHRIRTRNS